MPHSPFFWHRWPNKNSQITLGPPRSAMGGHRKSRRVEKSARANAKLWAEGCREDILSPHIAPYADAAARSFVAERDYVRRVQNEYHQLIPWRLPDDEEPPLPLPAYDHHLVPAVEVLTDEEQALKSRTIGKKNVVSSRFIRVRSSFLSLFCRQSDAGLNIVFKNSG